MTFRVLDVEVGWAAVVDVDGCSVELSFDPDLGYSVAAFDAGGAFVPGSGAGDDGSLWTVAALSRAVSGVGYGKLLTPGSDLWRCLESARVSHV